MSDNFLYHSDRIEGDVFPDRYDGSPLAVRNPECVQQYRIYFSFDGVNGQGIFRMGDLIYAFANGEYARIVL
jgi:hypothetical protein